jgi:hypothetical protein
MRRKLLPALLICLMLGSCTQDGYHTPTSYNADPNFCKEQGVCPAIIGAALIGALVVLSAKR